MRERYPKHPLRWDFKIEPHRKSTTGNLAQTILYSPENRIPGLIDPLPQSNEDTANQTTLPKVSESSHDKIRCLSLNFSYLEIGKKRARYTLEFSGYR